MSTEVEKLKKEIAVIETKRADHEHKHAEAVQRRSELEGHRVTLLGRVADNDQGARRELRTLDNRKQELDEDALAFATSVATVEPQLAKLQINLARAERTEAIAALKIEVVRLSELDSETEKALALVKRSTDAVFGAVTAVARQLRTLDPEKFDSRYESNLTSAIREAAWHRFSEMGVKTTEHGLSFFERVRVPLENALKQLTYMNLETVVPAKGELLYRTIGGVSGLRGLKLVHGSLIALTKEEGDPLVASGAAELVTEPIEHAA